MDKSRKKIHELAHFMDLKSAFESRKVVHCHGVFDVLHAGHLAYFQSAKKHGDILVVTLTADQYVNKGPGRPYFSENIRAQMLAALEVVDYVAINSSPTAVSAIHAIQPNYYVKGPDYRDMASDITGAIFLEQQAVETHGGTLVFTEDDTCSSSSLINRFFSSWTEEQSIAIEQVQKAGGLGAIQEALDRMKSESVVIMGEPIIDTYAFCKAEAISSKSPSISARFLHEENYSGGSLAIANHLCDFAKEVKLLFTHGEEPYFLEILKNKLDPRIKVESLFIPNWPTPRKTRYIEQNQLHRIFEMTHLRSDQWLYHSPKDFCALVTENMKSNDCAIVADFGHGLFEGEVISALEKTTGFLALNVQTNSSNRGFNPFTKHKRFSYLSLDTNEARVAYHDRYTTPIDLARRIRGEYSTHSLPFSLTLGSSGAHFFPKHQGTEVHMPTFTDTVIDATGAGDAYFGLTSLLVKVGCSEVITPFLGNVFAGLKTKIIGNKASIPKAQLVKAVTSILK